MPVFVKLPPFATDVEREVVLALAWIAQEAGAPASRAANTRPVEEPRLSVGTRRSVRAGRCGADPGIVAAVREATGGELPINACGGVSTAEDVRACLEAGADHRADLHRPDLPGARVVGRTRAGLARAR